MTTAFPDLLATVMAAPSDVINLATGEPFVPADVKKYLRVLLRAAADRAEFEEDVSSYSKLAGDTEFLASVRDMFEARYGVSLAPDELLVVPGCQVGLHLIWIGARAAGETLCWPAAYEFPQAVFPEGGEAAAPPLARRAGPSRCFTVELDVDGFHFPSAATAILSHPHNPTGASWSLETLSRLAAKAEDVAGWLVLDETYGFPLAPMSLRPPAWLWHSRVVHLFSFSKIGLAGERLGVMVGSPEFLRRIETALRRLIIQSPKLVQRLGMGLIHFYRGKPEVAASLAHRYAHNWRAGADMLFDIPTSAKIEVANWQGGPFLWMEHSRRLSDDEVFYRALEAGVAVIPGASLRTPESRDDAAAIRVGLGAEPGVFREGVRRLIPVIARC